MKTHNNIGCNCGCGAVGTVLGIITGVIIAVLFSLGLTPLILVGIWIAFGIAGAALLYILILAVIDSCSNSCCAVEKCLIRNLKCLLIGIFGTILSAIILLFIDLEITSIIVTIIVGLATFFFIFLMASLISFLKCLVYKF